MTGDGSSHRPHRDWKPVVASALKPRMSLVLQSLLPLPDSCQGRNPHQQGRGMKMIEQCYGGIDVSKDRLDVQVLPQGRCFSVDNTAAGWSQLVDRLRGLSIAALGIEPSGGYERGVIRACWPRACRCDASTPTNFVSSPAPAASWPRMIASMPG